MYSGIHIYFLMFLSLPPSSLPHSLPFSLPSSLLESLMITHNETLEVLAIKDLHSRLDDNKDGQVDYEESTEVGNLPLCFLMYSQI